MMDNDQLPLEDLVVERFRADEDARWAGQIGSPESLAASAEGGKALQTGKTVTSPLESISETVRQKALDDLHQSPIRGVVNTVLHQLTGGVLSLDVLQEEAKLTAGGMDPRETPLGKKMQSMDVLKLLDPLGNVAEAQARKAALDAGLDDASAEKAAGVVGMLAGLFVPGMGGKGKALKEGTKEALAARKAADITAGAARTTLEGANINVERIAASDAVKGVIKAVNALHAEQLSGARKTVSHAQTIEETAQQGMTLAEAIRVNPENFDMRTTQLAMRQFHNAAATHLEQVTRDTLAGDPKAAEQIWAAFTLTGELSMRDELLGKVGARGQESRKILSQLAAPFRPEDIAKLSETLEGRSAVDPIMLAKRLDALGKTARQDMARQAVDSAKSGRTNLLYEIWINSLLSGPQTHVVNMLSNAATAAWAVPERFLAATASAAEWGVTLGAHERTVYFGESAAMLYGMVEGMKDGIRMAGRALRDGISVGPSKVELGGDVLRQGMQQSDNAIEHGVGWWGSAWRSPTRLLTAEDAFFKSVNARGQLRALAYREAASEGLSPTAAEFGRRVEQLVTKPTSEMLASAERFANTNTFTRELDELGRVGQFGGGISSALHALPMGRVVMPFTRTPTNILHYASERTPLLNLVSDTFRADIMAGGERRAVALGKLGGGSMIGGVGSYLAASGVITGGGPSDPDVKRAWRDTGWQPYSLKIGGTYYSYNRLDPLGAILGTIADATEIIGNLPAMRANEIATATAMALARNMTSKTYLEGVAKLLEVFEKPDKDLGKYFMSFAPTLVPTLVRNIERAKDPTVREITAAPDATLRELQEFVNSIRASVPGWSESLPPKRNLFGAPVVLAGGWGSDMVSPIYASHQKDDPVANEIARLRLDIAMPSRFVEGHRDPRQHIEPKPGEKGPGTELTPKEYDLYVRLAGNDFKDTSGRGMKDTLAHLMTTTEYRQSPDPMRGVMIRNIVTGFRHAAEGAMLDPSSSHYQPALREVVEAKITANARKLVEPSSPAPLAPGLTR